MPIKEKGCIPFPRSRCDGARLNRIESTSLKCVCTGPTAGTGCISSAHPTHCPAAGAFGDMEFEVAMEVEQEIEAEQRRGKPRRRQRVESEDEDEATHQ